MNTLSLSEAVLRFTNDFFDVIFDSKIDKISSKELREGRNITNIKTQRRYSPATEDRVTSRLTWKVTVAKNQSQ